MTSPLPTLEPGLLIDACVVNQLIDHATKVLPLEACGLLAGTGSRISAFLPVTNAARSCTRYEFDLPEHFAAIRELRSRSLLPLAIWHSHPTRPARMSEQDLRLAQTPGLPYVILSLASALPELQAFRVINSMAHEIPIRTVRVEAVAA